MEGSVFVLSFLKAEWKVSDTGPVAAQATEPLVSLLLASCGHDIFVVIYQPEFRVTVSVKLKKKLYRNRCFEQKMFIYVFILLSLF
jgi:hypothetical protein